MRNLAKGEVGLREKKPAPTLTEFSEQRFEPWIRTTTSQKTWLDFYRVGVRAIKAYRPIAYSDDVNGGFQRDVNKRSGDVNKVGAQRRWHGNHA